jgi:hypothetical protein
MHGLSQSWSKIQCAQQLQDSTQCWQDSMRDLEYRQEYHVAARLRFSVCIPTTNHTFTIIDPTKIKHTHTSSLATSRPRHRKINPTFFTKLHQDFKTIRQQICLWFPAIFKSWVALPGHQKLSATTHSPPIHYPLNLKLLVTRLQLHCSFLKGATASRGLLQLANMEYRVNLPRSWQVQAVCYIPNCSHNREWSYPLGSQLPGPQPQRQMRRAQPGTVPNWKRQWSSGRVRDSLHSALWLEQWRLYL